MDKNSVLMVTGANGHLGYNLATTLHGLGYKVRASVRDATDPEKTDRLRAAGITDIVSLDVRDANTFAKVSKGVDTLFHVAATFRYYTGGKSADAEMISDSVEGARAAILAASKNAIKKVVLTSSIDTLPKRNKGEAPSDESDWRTDFRVPYMRAKTLAEQEAWKLAKIHDVNLVTILPGGILGPSFGRGTQTTDFIHGIQMGSMRLGTIDSTLAVVDVRDVVAGHIMAAEKDASGRFILCGDQIPTYLEILKIMRGIDRLVPRPMMVMPKFTYVILPAYDWLMNKVFGSPRVATKEVISEMSGGRYWVTNQRAKNLLGWTPQIFLEQTLRDTMKELKPAS